MLRVPQSMSPVETGSYFSWKTCYTPMIARAGTVARSNPVFVKNESLLSDPRGHLTIRTMCSKQHLTARTRPRPSASPFVRSTEFFKHGNKYETRNERLAERRRSPPWPSATAWHYRQM